MVRSDPTLFLGWGLGCGAYQEEAQGGPLLSADVPHRGGLEEASAHRPEHVLPADQELINLAKTRYSLVQCF